MRRKSSVAGPSRNSSAHQITYALKAADVQIAAPRQLRDRVFKWPRFGCRHAHPGKSRSTKRRPQSRV